MGVNLDPAALGFNEAGAFRLRKSEARTGGFVVSDRFNEAGAFRLRKLMLTIMAAFAEFASMRPEPFGSGNVREVPLRIQLLRLQ